MTQDSREQLTLGALFSPGDVDAAPPLSLREMPDEGGAASLSIRTSFADAQKKLLHSPEREARERQAERVIEVAMPAAEVPAPKELAPMLQQYVETKRQYPEHLLLFQVGDFYEVFFDDALKASEVLNIRLTSRNKDAPDAIPMCGVPIHALDNYLPKLLRAGISCVLVSQVEDGRGKKGAVQREISRIITPGIRFEGDGLDERSYNFLLSIHFSSRGSGAVTFSDVSTGVLRIAEVEGADELLDMLQRVAPTEVLLPSLVDGIPLDRDESWARRVRAYAEETKIRISYRPFERVRRDALTSRLQGRLSGGVPDFLERLSPDSLSCVSSLLDYVDDVSFGKAPAIAEFSFLEAGRGLVLDAATRRNLEITETRIDGDRRNSLIGRIDTTRTAMGARQLGEWVLSPSTNREEIEARHSAVEELISRTEALEAFREILLGVRDIDRLISRVTTNRAVPADLGGLRDSLRSLPRFQSTLAACGATFLADLAKQFDPLIDIWERLDEMLVEQPPIKLLDGGIIREGIHSELDRLKKLGSDGHSWLVELEQRERQATGISVLKVKYNNVFGYFIEVTKNHLERIPAHYERRQTLVNAERFVTRELKEFEQEVLSAKSRQIDLERELFAELRSWIADRVPRIQRTARVLSTIDVLCSFAHTARRNVFVRPKIRDDGAMLISGGRHPVVEQVLGQQNFIPNDVTLDLQTRRFAVLSGPNMGGKSTYLRQVGLIQLLAQAGSFVPAASAEISIVDRIFTRIGASDDLARGDSTFMMEMREAAIIAKKATKDSLVLVDELGRGTATTDGLAIARAIAEWLHDVIGCKSLFATHFHELNTLGENRDGVFCLSVGVVEEGDEIRFTHRIDECAAHRSFGLEVAQLAGLPPRLLSRAREVFITLNEHSSHALAASRAAGPAGIRQAVIGQTGTGERGSDEQTTNFAPPQAAPYRSAAEEQRNLQLEELATEIASLEIESLSPLQALVELDRLKRAATKRVSRSGRSGEKIA